MIWERTEKITAFTHHNHVHKYAPLNDRPHQKECFMYVLTLMYVCNIQTYSPTQFQASGNIILVSNLYDHALYAVMIVTGCNKKISRRFQLVIRMQEE